MSENIEFINRKSEQVEIEKVYGDGFIKFLYQNQLGKKIGRAFTNKYFSQAYGWAQDQTFSKKKVRPFIENFNIPIDLFEPGSDPSNDIRDSYKNFNEFFIRKYKPYARQFVSDNQRMPAFAEARYVGYSEVKSNDVFPVKGYDLKAADLLDNSELAKIFNGGPLLIARLCPVDYHRYHYPDDGECLESYRCHGEYHSVNPLALKFKSQIFVKNERHVSILKTKNFGRLAYIEVGAICVGKIVQSHSLKKPFKRGDEKGYFLFGGSTVIVLGEKGAWAPSADIEKNTKNGIETYIELGDEVGVKLF
jgi:phosphatidylserine decarboxylase